VQNAKFWHFEAVDSLLSEVVSVKPKVKRPIFDHG